jgi:glycerol-3-phosphate cytidylyltransferase
MVKGFTCGAMDVFHSGHVLMLKECKKACDYLIVGLHTNPRLDRPEKNKPVQSLVERYIQLHGSKYVDEIVPYETESDLVEILKAFDYDVRFVGSDWKDKPFTGYDIPGHLDKVIYNQREHDYSSSGLRKRVYLAERQSTIDQLEREEAERPSLYKGIIDGTAAIELDHE